VHRAAAACLTAGVLGTLGTFTAEPAAAAEGMEMALQDDAVFVAQKYYDRARALGQARSLGVIRVRANLIWSEAAGDAATLVRAPARPRYDFTRLDSLIEAAAPYGIRVHITLTGPAPAWASGDARVGPYRPSVRRFAAFARSAARHFRGRVDRYSIWNEPNYRAWLRPQRSAASLYRALYRAGYAVIKRADPRASVLIGETLPYSIPGRAIAPLSFLRRVACIEPPGRRRCHALRADGYAHHPYNFTEPPEAVFPGRDNATLGSLGNLTRELDRLAQARALLTPHGDALDLYLTEFGYFRSGSRRLRDPVRASYLVRAFDRARKDPRVRSMLHYVLVSPPPGFRADFDLGIVSASGRRLAPFRAVAAWARRAARREWIEVPP